MIGLGETGGYCRTCSELAINLLKKIIFIVHWAAERIEETNRLGNAREIAV